MAEGDVSGLVEGVTLYPEHETEPAPTPVLQGAPEALYPQPMHLVFPLQIRNGDFVMVAQDSQADIDGCVEVIARCPQGWLDSLPGMGLPDYTLTRGAPPVDDIRAGIEPYEPRADLSVDSDLEQLLATITLDPGTVT